MPRRKPTRLQAVQAAYAALSDEDKATFCHDLMTDESSPIYLMLCSMVADNFKLNDELDAATEPRHQPAHAKDPYLILRLKQNGPWSQVAAKLGISVTAARGRHRRAAARRAKETSRRISTYP